MAYAFLKPSKVIAVAVVGAATVWIATGMLDSSETAAPDVAAPAPVIPAQRVAVDTVDLETRERAILVSCVTEADQRAMAVARADGVLVELLVSQGDAVKSGETIAIMSDEGRVAAVKRAEALLAQRKAEFDANKRLIDQGNAPRNALPALEAALAAADAILAAAQAEADKQEIKSPIAGIVDSMPVQVGQAVNDGTQIAEIINPDPMLAVGAVSEFRRGSLRLGQNVAVRFVEGSPIEGSIKFVGLSAEPATRTYKVEAVLANPDAVIADGLTCEMRISLDPIEAASVPRSSLVFSDKGELGIRIVDADGRVRFVPIDIVDDQQASVWITGLEGSAQVIVVGQDFVKDGDPVEAVTTAEANEAAEPPA